MGIPETSSTKHVDLDLFFSEKSVGCQKTNGGIWNWMVKFDWTGTFLTLISDVILSNHCAKSVCIRSFSGPYSFRKRENTDWKNSQYGHFSRNESLFKFLEKQRLNFLLKDYFDFYLNSVSVTFTSRKVERWQNEIFSLPLILPHPVVESNKEISKNLNINTLQCCIGKF